MFKFMGSHRTGKLSFYQSKSASISHTMGLSGNDQARRISYSGSPMILVSEGTKAAATGGGLGADAEGQDGKAKESLASSVSIDILDDEDKKWRGKVASTLRQEITADSPKTEPQTISRERLFPRRESEKSNRSSIPSLGLRPRSPLHSDTISPPATLTAPATNATQNKQTMKLVNYVQPGDAILVVDDSSVFRQIACRMLGALLPHMTICEATDGLEAINLCAKNKYRLILMDLKMENMDGDEALYNIRLEGTTTPVVAVTAKR
ncbi:CheY-like superfamily [Chytridium lagenaria]|nr:CheY-like superfamily [Chytridium lagenaria]